MKTAELARLPPWRLASVALALDSARSILLSAQTVHNWQLLRPLAKPKGPPRLPDTQKWVPAKRIARCPYLTPRCIMCVDHCQLINEIEAGTTFSTFGGGTPPLFGLKHPLRCQIVRGDARDLSFLTNNSVHLVVTSPPYFDLKHYEAESPDQLGEIHDYEQFLAELDKVWLECARVLVPGGRICCVVGAITVARRQGGRHYVLPLPSDIQVRSRKLGLDNLTPIIWLKVGNIRLEASNSSRFLGKPNLPNGIIKNDFETIVMLRKPGGYRSPTREMELGSRIENGDYTKWFAPIWSDIPGASAKDHPAPFPTELAYRLIRMFSFAGDVVLDPFLGSGTTIEAAIRAGRHCIGVETEPKYVALAERRLAKVPFGVHLSVQDAYSLPKGEARRAQWT